MYPDADVFTLMYDEKKVGDVFPKSRVNCAWPAQWLFRLTGKPRASLPLMPFSVKRIDLSGYDLVISSSSGFAHWINLQSTIYNLQKKNPLLKFEVWSLKICKHVCYCHSPARYLWDATDEVQAELGTSKEERTNNKEERRNYFKIYILGPLVRLLFWWLRRVDLRASKSPDIYIANSREVQGRIQKYYNRDSVVLWPPVDTERFALEQRAKSKVQNGGIKISEREFYVVTSALTPFKQVDRVIRVMNRLNIPLKIIGDGAQRAELQKIAGKTIELLWKISDEEVVGVYRQARGFLMPQKEDAGIAPLEALAAGIPVFWLAKWGLLEVNIDGVTGRFFPEETDESFEQGFLEFDHEIGEWRYDDSAPLVARAREFDVENFRAGFKEIVQRHLKV
jgi:glycosyltransferase involved in cell wall biosynthesis